MKSLKVAGQIAAVVAALVMLGGCCGQDLERQIGVLKLDNAELRKMLTDEQQKNLVLNERIGSLQNDATKLNDVIDSKNQTIKILEEKVASLQKSLDERNAAYDLLVGRLGAPGGGRGGAPLPKEVNRLLKALASNYPGLLTFDEETGQMRFASDVTFDLGKVDIKPEAQKALRELAAILAQEQAKPVVLRIVGHTCTTRIAKPETLAKYPTNQVLSEARAKSVGDFLVQSTIDNSRITTLGMGESQLIDAANPKGARNRRVEIFLSMPTLPGTAPALETPSAPPLAPLVP